MLPGMQVERVQVPDLWEVVADRIRNQIIAGELKPGSRLVETELATRFGTSRGPIREALRELEREGIIITTQRRGTIVGSMTKQDLEEVYSVREALELLALREASRKADDATLQAIKVHLDRIDQAIASGDTTEVIKADLEFHRAILRAAQNSRLTAAWEQLSSPIALLVRIAMSMDIGFVRGEGGHHQQVWQALVERNPDRAGSVLSRNFKQVIKALFKSARFAPSES